MGKSNKELAVEVVIAAINANTRIAIPNANSVGSVTNSLTLKDVNLSIKSVYETLVELDKN